MAVAYATLFLCGSSWFGAIFLVCNGWFYPTRPLQYLPFVLAYIYVVMFVIAIPVVISAVIRDYCCKKCNTSQLEEQEARFFINPRPEIIIDPIVVQSAPVQLAQVQPVSVQPIESQSAKVPAIHITPLQDYYPQTDCSICLDKLQSHLYRLDCGHLYHESCLRQWATVKMNLTCPLCKQVQKAQNIDK